MNRNWLVCALASAAFAVVPAVRAADEVQFYDGAARKPAKVTGTIENETPSGIVLKSTGAVREVPASIIIEVVYEVPGNVLLDYGRARAEETRVADPNLKEEERQKHLADALAGYRDLQSRLTGEKSRFARCHMQYKAARLLARQAEDDPTQAEAAVEALQAFRKQNPGSWQLAAASQLLGRLQLERGDADGAYKTFQELAGTESLAKEAKQEADLLMGQALIRGRKFAEAEKLLKDLQSGLPADDPQSARLQIYLAQCLAGTNQLDQAVTQLEGFIAKTTSKELKAVAYNTLGDCYLMRGRPKDALWSYLWVDVIYHQDRKEHAKAVGQLAKLFKELGDEARAKQYQDKLRRTSR